jgi:hypothetical protein
MVKVVVDDAKGLVQSAGGGLTLSNNVTGTAAAGGIEFVKYGAVQSLNDADDYDDEIALPAGAMITDVGVQFLTLCKTANNGATDILSLKVGLSAGGTEIVDNTAVGGILIQNKTGVAGSMTSVSSGLKAEAAQPAALLFVPACLMRDPAGAARSIHTRLVNATSALATPGTARTFVKYIII